MNSGVFKTFKKRPQSYINEKACEEFRLFLVHLPLEQVFGWSPTYCDEICTVISRGDSDIIYQKLMWAEIQIIDHVSIEQKIDDGSYASIFKGRSNGREVIVKAVLPETEEKFKPDIIIRSIYEVIIGIFMHSIFANMEGVCAPTIHAYGYVLSDEPESDEPESDERGITEHGITKYPTIIMSPLVGKEIKALDSATLETFVYKTAQVLNELQKHYSFSHRDLHTGNIRYNIVKAEIEMFDFGESCFKWPGCTNALQLPDSDNYSISKDKIVEGCSNPSFDLAMLVLACYNDRGGSDYINDFATSIFATTIQNNDKITSISWQKFYKYYNIIIESCKPERYIVLFENYINKENRENRVLFTLHY